MALIVSLAVDAGMIAVLLAMGDVTPQLNEPRAQSISTINLSSKVVQAISAGASAAPASTSTARATKVDATSSAPIPREWSVTTLPPVVVPKMSPLPPASPSLAVSASLGAGSAGKATGAGYDPYAYASYRAPSAAVSSIVVSPEAIGRLETLLSEHIALSGAQIAARVDIDSQGRITRFLAGPGVPPASAAKIAALALGFALCPPDSKRPVMSDVAVSLNV